MRKKLVTLGMAGLMTAMSVVPAFAAPEALTAKGGQLTEGQTYTDGGAYKQFDGLADDQDSIADVDYWQDETYGGEGGKEFGVAGSKSTEVGVQQAMSYTVTIPSFISLNGAKGDPTANKAEYYVAVEGDIAGSSVITVLPNLTSAIDSKGDADSTTYAPFAATGIDAVTGTSETAVSGTGEFPLIEEGGIKKNLKATITLSDVYWNMKKDVGTGDVQMLKTGEDARHMGEISVANLSAGTFKNTINFDVAYTNSATATVQP